MFHQLVNHNNDIARLVEKGYAVAFDNNYLVIRDVPYLDQSGNLQIGAIVSKLVFTDPDHVIQEDHQIFFAGSVPFGLDGNPIPNLGGGPTSLSLSQQCSDVVVQRSFSNKPQIAGRFSDFFEKIESYVTIISGPAIERYQATPYTYRKVDSAQNNSVFLIQDTLTSRAEITDLSAKFDEDTVAIIGLGGTGAYILDLLAKTPAREIRVFDADPYHVHNAFRSPGRLELNEFNKPKAEVYYDRYTTFRNGLVAKSVYVDSSCHEDLVGVTFAFVCVDKGSARSEIFDLLIAMGIPFIDVGMGLNRKKVALNGMLRTTYYSTENANELKNLRQAATADDPDDVYKTNIQIAELNSLNACLAVIRFKQLRGFYAEENPVFNLLFEISDLKVVAESSTHEV